MASKSGQKEMATSINDGVKASSAAVHGERDKQLGDIHNEADPDVQDVEAEASEASRPPHSIFTKGQKRFIVAMVTMASIFSPLTGTIYLPALNTLSKDLRVSTSSINLTVTSYQIFQGLAPLFFGNLADVNGRRPVYIICFIIYLCANLGLALQKNYAALFVLRALQSTGCSGTIALGSAVMADIVTSAERGEYVGWAQAGTQLGPALGPIFGGILAQFLGWPAIFWFLFILAGVYLLVYTIIVPETARNVVGNGSVPPQGWNRSLIFYLQQRARTKAHQAGDAVAQSNEQSTAGKRNKFRLPNPLKSLQVCLEKDMSIILFNISLMVTALYCIIVPLPALLKEVYGYNDLEIGLCFLPMSAGSAMANVIGGRFLDYNYRRIARKIGATVDKVRGDDLRNFPIEKARLQAISFLSVIGAFGIGSFGWSFQARTSLAAPMVVCFVLGITLSGSISMYSTLIVDLYPQSPATAMGAVNITRCLMSAAGTALIQHIIDRMGVGWCFTFLGLLYLLLTPSLLIVVRKGPQWREERFVRLLKQKEAKERKDAAKRGTGDLQAVSSRKVSDDVCNGKTEKELEKSEH